MEKSILCAEITMSQKISFKTHFKYYTGLLIFSFNNVSDAHQRIM